MSKLSKSVQILSNMFTLHNIAYTIIDSCSIEILLIESNIKKVYEVLVKLGYTINVGHTLATVTKEKSIY